MKRKVLVFKKGTPNYPRQKGSEKKKIESTVLLRRGHRFFFLSLLPWSLLGFGPQRKCPIWNLKVLNCCTPFSLLFSVGSLWATANHQSKAPYLTVCNSGMKFWYAASANETLTRTCMYLYRSASLFYVCCLGKTVAYLDLKSNDLCCLRIWN